MAEGDVRVVIRGLAKDAEDADKDIVRSVARITDDPAGIEDGNVARVLDGDAKAADAFKAPGEKGTGPRAVPNAGVRTMPARPTHPRGLAAIPRRPSNQG
jgi:hypothetical protein